MGLCFDSDKKQAERDFVQSLIVVQVVPVMQVKLKDCITA
jgi:hypothetical protein